MYLHISFLSLSSFSSNPSQNTRQTLIHAPLFLVRLWHSPAATFQISGYFLTSPTKSSISDNSSKFYTAISLFTPRNRTCALINIQQGTVRPEWRVRYHCGAVGICVTKCTQDARAQSQRHRRYVSSQAKVLTEDVPPPGSHSCV